jgi:hypothetical protein
MILGVTDRHETRRQEAEHRQGLHHPTVATIATTIATTTATTATTAHDETSFFDCFISRLRRFHLSNRGTTMRSHRRKRHVKDSTLAFALTIERKILDRCALVLLLLLLTLLMRYEREKATRQPLLQRERVVVGTLSRMQEGALRLHTSSAIQKESYLGSFWLSGFFPMLQLIGRPIKRPQMSGCEEDFV